MAKMKEIGDFGEKIGGARKDLAQLRKLGGFNVDDIAEWSDIERDKHIIKKEVFVKPDYQKLYDSGEYSKEALYFQQRMYKALPTKPYLYPYIADAREAGKTEADGIHAGQEAYIRFVNKFREMLSEVKDRDDVLSFSKKVHDLQGEQKEFFKAIDWDTVRKMNKNFVTSNYSLAAMISKMDKEKFLYTDDEKKLADTTILKYDGKNIYKEFYVNAEVEGSVPLEDRTLEAAREQTPIGRLRDAQYRVENDRLVVSGRYTNYQASKSENTLAADVAALIAEGQRGNYYKPLGELQNVSVSNVQIENNTNIRFAYRTGNGTHYMYHLEESPLADIEKYEEGKYVVLANNGSGVVGINYDTLEEAKKSAIEFVTLRDAAREAVAKAVKEGKTKLLPPQLKHVHRVGEDYLDGGNVEVKQKVDPEGKPLVKLDEKDKEVPSMECPAFEQELGFRAGEFGNWENQEDRRVNLNMAYEAFRDMSKALNISEKDASLGGDLAIAFGSRGRGGSAVAHFEPASNVINLTKMRGAGSLGHEWGHALDYAIARAENRTIRNGDGWLETDYAHKEDSLLHDVVDAMKYAPEGGTTQYYKDAKFLDDNHSKSDKGYWQSDAEMLARAFHTYLLDKLKEQGIRNDYLCGHAEYLPEKDKNGNPHYTYPRGEERKRINQEFGKLVEKLKEREIFHEQTNDKEHQLVHSQDGVEQNETKEQVQENLTGQLELDLEAMEKKTTKKEVKEQAEKQNSSADKSQDKPAEEKSSDSPAPSYGTSADAGSLKVDDVVRLSGHEMTDARGRKETFPPEYARVTDVDADHIDFQTSPDDPTVPLKWDNGRESYCTVGDKHWSEMLAERGFEVVSKAPEMEKEPEIMHIVNLRSSDPDKLSAMHRYIDMSFPDEVTWSNDNESVEMSDSVLKDFQSRIESPDFNDFMKNVVAEVEFSVDEPFKTEPDFYHTIYLKGDATDILRLATTLDEITDFKADVSKDFSAIKILDSDLSKYTEWLQSDAVQKNNDLISHISRIDQSLDEPFEKEVKEIQNISKEEGKPMAEDKNGWGRPQAETEQPKKKPFPTTPNLKKLEETMKEHKPFAVMAMSTSGVDAEAEPIRAVVQEYVFNDELKTYEKGIGFDEMVKCSQEQLDKMLTDEHYDYFGNAGIDKDAYIRGEGVLSKEDFSKSYTSFMKALEQDGKELLIINGGATFAEGQLAKVSPEAQQTIKDKALDRTAISQTSLTSEYFRRHDIHEKVTLENLRDAIMPSPSGSFKNMLMENSPRMDDFKSMSKEEFCKTAGVTSYQYDATVRDFKLHEDKIIGADARVELIAHFAEIDGREKGILESEYDSHWREADVKGREQRSEEGKVKYQNYDYEQKLNTLVSQGVVEPEVVLDRSSDCDLNKFLNVMEKKGIDGESQNKGFVVIQAATTGFDKRGVGEPIQVSAIAFDLNEDGSIEPVGGISEYNIKASDRAVINAVNQAERGKFDAFKYADVDVDKYRSGEGVHSKEESLKELSDFFKSYPSSDYPIVSNGSGKNDPALTFSQEALLSLGSVEAFGSHNSIDFTQVIKEYSYAAYHRDGAESVVAKEDEIKNFGLDAIVAANGELTEALRSTQGEGKTILGSTLQKVNATAILADSIRMQDMELHRPELFAALAQSQQQEVQEVQPSSAPLKEATERTVSKDGSIPVVSAYDDNEVESPEASYVNSVDIADILDDPSEAKSVPVEDTREHGNLYSDKKGDTRDVVIVEGNIKKVAEVEIPHVSEVLKDADKEQQTPQEEPRNIDDKQRGREAYNRFAEHRKKREEKPRLTPAEKPVVKTSDHEAEYLAIIKSQQEMMKSMQEEMKLMREELSRERAMNRSKENTISLFSKQLSNALEKQTELMAKIAGVSQEEVVKDYKSMTSSERVDAIENIKDEIVKIKETVPLGSRESTALASANMQLSNAQKHMEQEKPTPNKAG